MTLAIEYKNVSYLIPYVNNSRTHSEQQVKQIAASIKEFGFTNPVLIDEQNGVIAGHGRLLAAELLRLDSVPTICLNGLTEAQRKAYVIADNSIALNSSWDIEKLHLETEILNQFNFDVELLALPEEILNTEAQKPPTLGLTPEEKLDNFLNGDTKILRLAYTQEELEFIVEKLDEALKATGAEDYSTVVFDLVAKESTKW